MSEPLVTVIPIANEVSPESVAHAITNLHSQARFMNEYAYRYIRDLLEAMKIDLNIPRTVPVLCVVKVVGRLFGSDAEYISFNPDSLRLSLVRVVSTALVMSEATAKMIAGIAIQSFPATVVRVEMVETDGKGLPITAPVEPTQQPDKKVPGAKGGKKHLGKRSSS